LTNPLRNERQESEQRDNPMRYRLEIKEEARQQLRALDKEHRRNIGWRLDALQTDLAGDVKKLSARTHEYRLRVGNFRVLFLLEGDLISVYAVKDRKEAYE
jgi:mRNA interferase RelE/StbE